MAARRRSDDPPPPPIIRVAPLGELQAYTVYEHELDTLARGSPGSTLLSFSYALIPVAITILVTLLSTTVSQVVFVVFVCAFLILLIAGVICLVLGWQTSGSTHTLVEQIKNRMPPPPTIQQTGGQEIEPAGPPPAGRSEGQP